MTRAEARYHQVVRLGVALMGVAMGVTRPDILVQVALVTLPVLSMEEVERRLREGSHEPT